MKIYVLKDLLRGSFFMGENMAEPITDYKTQEALNESLAEWQERLFLQHWNIKAALVHGEEIEGCGGECTVQWANSCGTIRLRYANEMPEGMEKMPHEKILVHELLHFKYMGFQEANASIEGIYYDEKQHQLIEQMAKSLIMAKYGIDYEWFKT